MSAIPFNIKLLKLTPSQIRTLKPITTLDRYDGPNGTNFHENGLFSTEIFGRTGEDSRDETFGVIPLKTSILHPIVWTRLEKIKRLYHGILNGRDYAVWDPKLKDFIKSNELEGETGYEFFMSHWNELKPDPGESQIRQRRVELIDKYRNEAVLTHVLVMPAGLRDTEIDELGRTQEDEINDHYRRLIGVSNTIGEHRTGNVAILDNARLSQQAAFNAIYAQIESMLSGKRGFIQDKWGSRHIVNGTRNVISSMDASPSSLDDKEYPDPDSTIMGLWQLSRSVLEITIHKLKTNIIDRAFKSAEGSVRLIDNVTLESELVAIDGQIYDQWTTTEGLEKVISSQSMIELRSKPVMIAGRYLALIYKPKDVMGFKILFGIEDLPEGYDRKDVYPMTYHEMIYLCNYAHWNDLMVLVTRYPVSGEGSTYTSKVFVKTTVNSERRHEFDDNFNLIEDDDHAANVYPVFTPEAYVDTMQVHPFRMKGLGAD